MTRQNHPGVVETEMILLNMQDSYDSHCLYFLYCIRLFPRHFFCGVGVECHKQEWWGGVAKKMLIFSFHKFPPLPVLKKEKWV